MEALLRSGKLIMVALLNSAIKPPNSVAATKT
jgi:hypothetical protein